FFFSSRRRHTRWPRDWSSDVCSSDLGLSIGYTVDHADMRKDGIRLLNKLTLFEVSLVNMPANRLAVVTDSKNADGTLVAQRPARSEERRVGKEWRARGGREQ